MSDEDDPIRPPLRVICDKPGLAGFDAQATVALPPDFRGAPSTGELSAAALARVAKAVEEADPPPGWVGGKYRLIEVVGVGGMGEVWRAEQEQPIRRTVALKLIKLGMDTREVIARFEMERQALALMNHPNIAKVLDAGATDSGRPYFVMEYVAGEPITLFCDRHSYSIRQRLQLFLQACAAVGHAHQRGVLHRDLKSVNILVSSENGDPQVKVIDFGIAKALQASAADVAHTMQTLTGQLVGTPEYMSPEQALTDGRDVDTRSDVYSLGVVLYELLGGMLPFDPIRLRSAGLAEIQRVIREVEPIRPSARLSSLDDADAAAIAQRRQTAAPELIRQLRRELEWIPLKAIRKDPSARYTGVSEFARDVENYLEQRPLIAGPESRRYRLRKLLRRRRLEAIAASLVILSLLAGMIGTITFAVRESRQRDLAEHRAEETTKIAGFQAEMLSGLDVERMGLHLRQDLLDEAERGWRTHADDEEEIARRREELRSLLVDANFTSTAKRSLNENVFVRSLKAIDREFADQPLVKAKLLQQLATTLREFTLLDSAMPPQVKALEIRRRELREDDPDMLESMSAMGLLLGSNGKWSEAEAYARRVLDLRPQRKGEDDVLTLRSKRNLAEALQRQGLTRVAEAERYRFEVLAGFRRIRRDDDDPETLEAMLRVGQVLLWQKKLQEAEPYLEQALDRMRQTQVKARATFIAAGVLARLKFFQEHLDQAEQLARESFEGLRQSYGDDSRDVLFASRLLGSVYRAQGDPKANGCLQRAVDGFRRVLPPDHLDTLLAIQELGVLRYQQRNFPEAQKNLVEALEGFRRVRGVADEDALWTLHYLGWCRQSADGWSAAEPLFRDLYEKAQVAKLPPLDAARFMSDLGPCLVMLSKYDQAAGPLLEAHKRLSQTGMQRDERMRVVVWGLAEMYDHTGRPSEAARWREELSRLRAATQPTRAATSPSTVPGSVESAASGR
jgi:non-specific serine/threonine protein kinase/serine/threonine-protein kinase